MSKLWECAVTSLANSSQLSAVNLCWTRASSGTQVDQLASCPARIWSQQHILQRMLLLGMFGRQLMLVICAGAKHSASAAGIWRSGEVLQVSALQAQDSAGPFWGEAGQGWLQRLRRLL